MVVLGMVHEHQRWDRDDYVDFRCKNLIGMDEAVKRALESGGTEDERWKELCTVYTSALNFGALSHAFMEGAGLDPEEKKQLNGPDGFDYDSIMLYSSGTGVKQGEEEVTMDNAPLVKVKKNGKGEKYVDPDDWIIYGNSRPSPRDAEFVRRFYPWGPPRPPGRPSPGPPGPPVEVQEPPALPVRPSPNQPPPLPPRPSR